MTNSTPDTAEAKIREILENYTVDEATKQLKGLLVDARIDEIKDKQAFLEDALRREWVGFDKSVPKFWIEIELGVDDERLAALQQTRQEEVRE